MSVHEYISQTLENIKKSSPGQTTFLQAATEVLHTLEPLLTREKKYLDHKIVDRIVMPERTTMFRVT